MKKAWQVARAIVDLHSRWKQRPHQYIEISPIVGCPNVCMYCPQKVFLRAYKKSPGRRLMMTLSDFKRVVDNSPPKTKISFAGFAEPFGNPECTDMVEYALSRCQVMIYTTLVGLTVDNYRRFKGHPNLVKFVLHLPDADGATKIRIDGDYLRILKCVVNDKPPGFATDILGRAEHPEISHIIRSSEHKRISNRAGNVDSDCSIVSNTIPHGTIRCGFWWLTNYRYGSGLVLPDGTTLVCCMDWSMEWIIGNAFSQTIAEMRRSEKYHLCLQSCENDRVDSICRRCESAARYNGFFSDPRGWFLNWDYSKHIHRDPSLP